MYNVMDFVLGEPIFAYGNYFGGNFYMNYNGKKTLASLSNII
jgi:hypothetical protein